MMILLLLVVMKKTQNLIKIPSEDIKSIGNMLNTDSSVQFEGSGDLSLLKLIHYALLNYNLLLFILNVGNNLRETSFIIYIDRLTG